MNKQLVISFKITNWCNLHCAHCCERSNKHNAPDFMSLEKLNKYLAETSIMDTRPNQLLAISGGEALAPYILGNTTYIPNALDLIYTNNYVPVLKTNGTWGDNETLRKKILSDIALKAYKYQKLVTLDISVDEFHNNQSGVIKIINNIVRNPGLSFAIRICLVGFNTPASKTALNNLQQQLQNIGLKIKKNHIGDLMIEIPNSINVLYVYTNYIAQVVPAGRAKQTKTFTTTHRGDNDGIDCLQIDNHDYAILNYQYREPIKNRPLNTVLQSLMSKVY